MQSRRVWARAIGVDRRVVIEGVDVDESDESVVVSCRLRKGAKLRCGLCERRSGRYDHGEGRRRWRALDAGTTRVFIEADAPRVRCRDHGVTVAWVPWARHGAGHTRDFDDQVAWLVTHTSKTAVVELMRIAWRTVGAIAARVVAEARELSDPFDGLERIGIDEISCRRGHKYLMVVVDHDTGRLVWASAGHDRATLQIVFQHRGDEATAMLNAWLQWARRCQIPAFVELYHHINKHRAGIIAAVTHGLSNGLTESVNTKLRLLTRIAYGFRSTDNLIALCLLDRGGYCPNLPGRD